MVGLGRVLRVEMRPAVGVRNGCYLGAEGPNPPPLSIQDPDTRDSACSRITIHVGDNNDKHMGMNKVHKAEIYRIVPILQGYLRAHTYGHACGRSDRSNEHVATAQLANARVWGI